MKNQEIKDTLEQHLPKEEHSALWETLNKPLAVVDEHPINLEEVWAALNTVVTASKAHELWVALNRPISWPFKG